MLDIGYWQFQPLLSIADFFERGGAVLWPIGIVSLLLWTLIIQRYLFFIWGFKHKSSQWHKEWISRSDQCSWYALSIREELISRAKAELSSTLSSIKTLIAICPMLGLLGTVTGMVEVFDVIALSGNSNVRGVAAGVSKATIPTMAGMVVALTGYYFASRLRQLALHKSERFADSLIYN